MRRRAAVAATAAVMVLVPRPAAVHAIETASFGLTPGGDRGTRTSLHETVKPGQTTNDAVRLFNKQADRPVSLTLSVEGASLDEHGQVKLGGTGGAARWLRLSTSTVVLPPKGSVTVPLTVHAPRTMPKGTSTAAVVAEPAAGSGTDVAVLQRVALMVYVTTPEGSSLRAALGWVAWVAAVLLAGVVVYALSGRGPRRRRPGPSAPDGPRP